MKSKSIEHYRRKINRIDRRIMKMLIERYGSVESIGMLKKKDGLEVVDNKRERDILRKIEKLKTGIKEKYYIASIYRAVFSSSYKVEKEK